MLQCMVEGEVALGPLEGQGVPLREVEGNLVVRQRRTALAVALLRLTQRIVGPLLLVVPVVGHEVLRMLAMKVAVHYTGVLEGVVAALFKPAITQTQGRMAGELEVSPMVVVAQGVPLKVLRAQQEQMVPL